MTPRSPPLPRRSLLSRIWPSGLSANWTPKEHKDLAEAAKEGDADALEELKAGRVEAIEAMIEALDDPESRKLIKLGMMLTRLTDLSSASVGLGPFPLDPSGGNSLFADHDNNDDVNNVLDGLKVQLEQQISRWSMDVLGDFQ